MIRDIKFRAWIKEQKQMVEVIELNFHQATIASIYDDYTNGEQEWDLEDFKNVELMQYVGLKDKDGTEIYEGDILFDESDEHTGLVNFNEGGFAFSFENITEPLANNHWCMEVIGNIYENPELLQGENE